MAELVLLALGNTDRRNNGSGDEANITLANGESCTLTLFTEEGESIPDTVIVEVEAINGSGKANTAFRELRGDKKDLHVAVVDGPITFGVHAFEHSSQFADVGVLATTP